MAVILHFPQRQQPPVFPVNDQKKKAIKRSPDREREITNSMLAKIHIAKKDMMRLPGFDETVYRDILEVNFGVSSSAELSNAQLHRLLIFFASLGWQAKKGRHRREAPKALVHDATGMNRE